MTWFRNLVLAAGLAAFGLAGSVAAARAAEPGVTDDTITIGTYGPLTGPAASVGLGARDGFNMAIKEINAAGGINGRKLKVLTEDDGYSPARALAATKKLIDQDGVFMIVSLGGSNDTLSTIDYVKSQHRILYASIASVPAITQPFNKYLFRGATAEVARYSEVNTEFVTQALRASRIAIISGRDEYSHNKSEGDIRLLKSWWNLTPVARVEFNLGDHDFTPQILQIKAASPDVIMVVANPAEGAVIIRQIRELGLATPMFVSSTMVDKATAATAGAAAEGLTASYLLPYELELAQSRHGEVDGRLAQGIHQPAAGTSEPLRPDGLYRCVRDRGGSAPCRQGPDDRQDDRGAGDAEGLQGQQHRQRAHLHRDEPYRKPLQPGDGVAERKLAAARLEAESSVGYLQVAGASGRAARGSGLNSISGRRPLFVRSGLSGVRAVRQAGVFEERGFLAHRNRHGVQMSQKSFPAAAGADNAADDPSAERFVRDIRRATGKHPSAEDKIRIVMEGLRGDDGRGQDAERGRSVTEGSNR